MHTLTHDSRAFIARRVWAIWALKKAVAPASFIALILVLASLVSLGNILRAGFESAGSPGSLWAFLLSAFSNAGVIVIAITVLAVVSGTVCLKSLIKNGASGISFLVRRFT